MEMRGKISKELYRSTYVQAACNRRIQVTQRFAERRPAKVLLRLI